MKKLLLLIFLLVHGLSFGQETHYWFHNFGTISLLKGGIEVGGIRNVAAAYYNPGALAFIDGKYFEGQADVKNTTSTQYHNFIFTIGVNLNIEKEDN